MRMYTSPLKSRREWVVFHCVALLFAILLAGSFSYNLESDLGVLLGLAIAPIMGILSKGLSGYWSLPPPWGERVVPSLFGLAVVLATAWPQSSRITFSEPFIVESDQGWQRFELSFLKGGWDPNGFYSGGWLKVVKADREWTMNSGERFPETKQPMVTYRGHGFMTATGYSKKFDLGALLVRTPDGDERPVREGELIPLFETGPRGPIYFRPNDSDDLCHDSKGSILCLKDNKGRISLVIEFKRRKGS